MSAVLLSLISLFHLSFGIERLFFFFDPQRAFLPLDRAHWPFVNPNHSAAFLEMSLVLLLSFLFFSLGSDSRNFSARREASKNLKILNRGIEALSTNAILYIFLAVIFLALFLTLSKMGVFLGVFSFCCLYFVSSGVYSFSLGNKAVTDDESSGWRIVLPLLKTLFFVSSALLLIFFLIGDTGRDSLISRYEFGAANPDLVRFGLLKATLFMFLEFPVWGIGAGCWDLLIPAYISSNLAGWKFDYAHNEALQLFAEFGLVGGLLFLLCIMLVSVEFFKVWNKNIGLYNRGFLLGIFLALALPMLHGLVDFHFRIPAISLAYTMVLGVFFRLLFYLERIPE